MRCYLGTLIVKLILEQVLKILEKEVGKTHEDELLFILYFNERKRGVNYGYDLCGINC